MRCDICGCVETYVKDYEHNFTTKGRNIKFTSKRRFCKKCNNLVYDPKLDNIASEKALSTYSKEYGITKEEIIELREKYNLSQELFSKVIGCAKKTLISYEKGKSIPNDSYLIILRSLMSKPDTIKTLINANKEQFTDKEYERIEKKIYEFLIENDVDAISGEEELNEYNGYTCFSKEKLYNIILYLSDKSILKTKLLKEMFYVDFLNYKNLCKSMTGLEYVKLPLGPVPDNFENILNECLKNNIIDYTMEVVNNYEFHNIKALDKFDKSLFTKEELDILETVKNKFKSFGSKEIVDFVHKEKAFTDSKKGEKISYDYAFDIESV